MLRFFERWEEQMKYTELVMVVENYKGAEHNYLLTEADARTKILRERMQGTDYADFFMELGKTKAESPEPGEGAWATAYFRPNYTVSMSYCHGQVELIGFLDGNFNDSPKDWSFDREECSEACLKFLRANKITEKGKFLGYPDYSYRPVEHVFKQGEVLMNLNGCEYRILQCLSPRNLLLMDTKNGQFTVGVGTGMFERRLKEIPDDDPDLGIEWEHGIYLGNMPSQIDFDLLRREYGESKTVNNIYEYRQEMKEKFLALWKITDHPLLPESLREAATNAMYECFMTGKRDTFMDNLENGKYDAGYHNTPEQRKEPVR